MDPEQRLLVIIEYFAVKFLVLIICALIGMFHPQVAFVSLIETGRLLILAFSLRGDTSTTISFLRFHFHVLRSLLLLRYLSTTTSSSLTSAASIVSYSCSAFAFDKKISTGMNEQYLFSTSRTRYSFANSTLSSDRYNVIVVPIVSFEPSVISKLMPPSDSQ